MVQTMKNELEKQLIKNIKELSNIEQDEIKIYTANFIKLCENTKREKIQMFRQSIIQQIKFYGKIEKLYKEEIENLVKRYEDLIQKTIDLYIIWFLAIISELQNIYDNQKISIANCKITIDLKKEEKRKALENKTNNYEIIIQECKKQIKDCKTNMNYKINQIFYNKLNSLDVRKNNIYQKIMNIIVGKSRIKKFVIDSLNLEIGKIERDINEQTKKINEETIKNIARIEDAILQTEEIFNIMLKEYKYDGE